MEINGKPVVDAKKSVKINITERDVETGNNKNPGSCAAAKAAKHSLKCISARVHIGRVYIEQEKQWVRYTTPAALRTEIVAFDKGGSFQPGEYKLSAMAPSATEYRHGSTTNKNGSKITKRPRKRLIARVKQHSVTGIRPKGANR